LGVVLVYDEPYLSVLVSVSIWCVVLVEDDKIGWWDRWG